MSNRKRAGRLHRPRNITPASRYASPEARRNVRANALALLVAAYHGDHVAIRNLMPDGNDPDAMGNSLLTVIQVAADLLHEASGFDPEKAAEKLEFLWATIPGAEL